VYIIRAVSFSHGRGCTPQREAVQAAFHNKKGLMQTMTKRKIGRVFLVAGITILLVALLLLFNTNSPWALITLVLSIILNTIGLSVLMVRSVRDGTDDD
jgi:hypothetical protein